MITTQHEKPCSLLLLLTAATILLISCSDKKSSPSSLEYRKDENGSLVLYELGADEPYGKRKQAFVSEDYPNGEIHFKISFSNGRKDGPFTFWQKNGLKLLTGSYKNGKRHGLFSAYGKTGELIYEKNFFNDELDGNFTLYYPASKSDVLRFFEKLREDGLELGKLQVKNHLRLQAKFSNGNPTGSYQAYYHPGGRNLSLDQLIREEGSFSQLGLPDQMQVRYYPRAVGLVVVHPDKSQSDTIHPASPDGFSRAIDEAKKVILDIPAYRNPDNLPALVFTLDDRGNEIVPIWSSHILEFAVRKMDGSLMSERFEATYESFSERALPFVDEILLAWNLRDDANLLFNQNADKAVEIIGLDSNGGVVDVLWTSNPSGEVVPLNRRIFEKRRRVRRLWDEGESSEAVWLLNNGSSLTLRGSPNSIAENLGRYEYF